MFKILFSITIFMLSYQFVNAQTNDTTFKKEWIHIDTLIIKKNQPKTALKEVNQLYTVAKQKQLQSQIIKCLVYRLSLEDRIFDNKPNNAISILETEISSSSNEAVKSILYNLLANRYLQYFNANRWKFYNRSKTINFIKTDIETWNIDDFNEAIANNYLLSIQQAPLLQTLRLETFDAIVIKGNARNLRPTLYDVLMHEALDYFKSGNYYITKPAIAFELNNINALAPNKIFTNTKFQSKDSASHLLICLQLFQQLINFHVNDDDKNALLDVDIERIEWVYSNIIHAEKEKKYKTTLQSIANYSFSKAAQANYLLALIETQLASNYQPFGDTINRYANVEALKIINKALTKFTDESEGTVNLMNLKIKILERKISTETEKVNIPNQPFRTLVSYKNVDTLFVRIIDVKKIKDNSYTRKSKTEFELYAHQTAYKSFYQILPKTNDYQTHSVEIKIDALPVGEYILLTSSGKNFVDTVDEMSKQQFYVSNISYVRNGNDYFVLNRETGLPLNNVEVKIYKDEWVSTKNISIKKLIETKKTNKNGYFQLTTKENYYNYYFHFIGNKDELNLNASEYYYRNYSNSNDDDDDDYDKNKTEEYEKDKAKIFFFTDRAIYRPGQTIYFKGIGITTDFKSKQQKVYNPTDSIKIFLLDANNNEIDSLQFKPNIYGSFSGNFKIPLNVLTGNFSIEADDIDNSEKKFRVEEYKRPKFYVEFNNIKGSYKVNDSVTITGFAKAYAGNNIDNAKATISITRKARFIYDWYWRGDSRPTASNVNIIDTTITTDASGQFSITFKAIADAAVDKNSDPLFDYAVETSVTDNNGETREANTTVTVGYKSLLLTLTSPSIAIADSTQTLTITTKNLSNETLPAIVDVKIFAIQTPQRLIRKRLWQQPDQFVFTKEQYLQHFPTDDYADELNDKNWAVNNLVFSTSINTIDKNNIVLPNTIGAGYYKIEAITKDKDGNEVKDIKYMQLFNSKASAYPQYNFSYTVNNYIQPNETANFLRGSMTDNVFIIQEIQNNNKKNVATIYNFVNNKKGIRSLNYKASEEDRGNVGINEVYIINNRVYTNHFDIMVPFTNKQLQVNYTSFRNKTEPGSKETYTVNIKGNNGEKVAAELLTTMYDASLEQFTKHQLQEPGIWKEHNYYNSFSYQQNFTKEISYTNSLDNIEKIYFTTQYDRLIKNYSDVQSQSDIFLRVVLQRDEKNLNEVVIVTTSLGIVRQAKELGYSTSKTTSLQNGLTGKVSGLNVQGSANGVFGDTRITLRGIRSITNNNNPLLIVDGVVLDLEKINTLNPNDIESTQVLKGDVATALYGPTGVDGAIIITTKNGAKKKEQEQAVKPRKNFNETAFFFPALYADSAGNYTFSFTIPEALTQWKWLSFAHTKDLAFGSASATITTQKNLMVQPNAPRFMREGDNMEFVTKIANLSDKELTGQCTLELIDAITGNSVDGWFQNSFPLQYFTVAANQSTVVKFPIQIPFNYNKPLTWRIIAKAPSPLERAGGEVSDGEENTLPILTNRLLVTESLPLYLKPSEKEKSFVFEKLLNNKSESLNHEGLIVEYTVNPIWTVIQSLPYLMEFPYECAEQTFNRMYANALASSIVNKYPKIKSVFEQWKKDSTTNKATKSPSPLERGWGEVNEELKQVLLQETPWVLNAATEHEKQKNIALLFDMVNMSNSINAVIEKLQQLQTATGGFAWFKGGYTNRYITNYILTGIGKLRKANALTNQQNEKLETLVNKALSYLDELAIKDYQWLINNKVDLNKNNISNSQIQYLYMRSFYKNSTNKEAYNYYYQQAKKYWNKQNTYNTALIGLVLSRNNESKFVNENILAALLENSIEDSVKGTIYWKDRNTCFWYASPIEHQSTMIEFLSEVQQHENITGLTEKNNAAKTWLILNKQTNNWQTTIATADACYVLLNTGSNWIDNNQQIQIKLGSQTTINQRQTNNEKQQTSNDYIKQRIPGDKVNPSMGNINVSINSSIQQSSPSYGAVYWQYFEDLDQITTSAAAPLSLKKKLFVERTSTKGKVLDPINDNDELKIGDKIIVRIELSSDRTMEYLHLKDMRASGTEPINVLSEYKWQDGLGYYEATKDASTNFFIDNIQKGTYVFEYPLYVTHTGKFSVGIATIQCMYAPEFTSHSEGIKILVK